MPHLVSTAYTRAETQPDSFGVTIDLSAEVISTAQTVDVTSVRLYYDISTLSVGVSHTYSIVAIEGVTESDAATGSFTISPWRSLFRL